MRPTDVTRTQRVRPALAYRRLVSRGLVPAAVLAGSLGATTLPAGASTSQSVVTTGKIAGLGTVLVASHRAVYELVSDPKGRTNCTGACTNIWKPLIVTSKQAHHLGHVSGLGTIHRSNGQLQVAMHGHALYWFVNDHSLSHAGGQGFLNIWFTVHPNGTLNRTKLSGGTIVTAPPTTPTSTPSSSSASTTTRPTSAPSSPASPNSSPAPTSPPPTSPPPTSPPTTSPPPPPPTTTPPPPTTTPTTSGGGGGVGF